MENSIKENKLQTNKEKGFIIIGVLFISTLSLFLAAGLLSSASSYVSTHTAVKKQASQYYQVEDTLAKTIGWLQINSKNILSAFKTTDFETNFDMGNPSLGTNEGAYFSVPTLVKVTGSTNTPMLSNNSFFGTPAFPNTTNVDTGAAFNPVTEFANADVGTANARVVLVWARETVGGYEPVFRVDVVTGNNPDRGSHSFSYVYSKFVDSGTPDPGFFGQNFLTLNTGNNTCESYAYTYSAGTWNAGAPRANCPLGSDANISVGSKVSGTAATLLNNGIALTKASAEISGGECDGAGCHSFSLPALSDWATACPSGGTSPTYTSDSNISGGCYDTVTINPGVTLTFNDTSNPYHIRYIDFDGNAEAHFDIGNGTDKITLNVEKFNSNDRFNGNQIFNLNNAPHQLELNYTGTAQLTLNGTASMHVFLTAPFAPVVVEGNFTYFGGIRALSLESNGNSRLAYDEAGGTITPVTDIAFSLGKASQRFR